MEEEIVLRSTRVVTSDLYNHAKLDSIEYLIERTRADLHRKAFMEGLALLGDVKHEIHIHARAVAYKDKGEGQ